MIVKKKYFNEAKNDKYYKVRKDPIFNRIARVYAQTIASNLVSVAPMSAPKGQLYWFDKLGK